LRNLPLFFLLAGGLLLACDSDGDGDGDGDGTGDSGPGTTPPADSDGDGLSDDEEVALGTDPELADTDGDTVSDYDETLAGTNPLWEYSHDLYQGPYNFGFCENGMLPGEEPSEAGVYNYGGHTYNWNYYAEGQVVPNFTMMDQYGDEISLYAFCGHHVMATFGYAG